MGIGIDNVLQNIITKIPSPKVDRSSKLRALLFDCTYDRYRGALSLIYIQDGCISLGDSITTFHNKKDYEVRTLSLLRPDEVRVKKLYVFIFFFNLNACLFNFSKLICWRLYKNTP